VREYPQKNPAFTMQKMRRGNTTRLDVSRRYPLTLQRLKTVITKRHEVGTACLAAHSASLALAMFDSFRH